MYIGTPLRLESMLWRRVRGLMSEIFPTPGRNMTRATLSRDAVPVVAQAIEGVLRPSGFSVLDVENLRLYHARTLGCWLERFEQATSWIAERFGECFVRAWRLYLAGSQAVFSSGSLQLFQVTFARSRANEIPWTRGGYGKPQ